MGYGIRIRVSGDYALFTRPEMKVERVSYEVMTPSAARGLIEAVYWKPAIRWVIDKIHVLNEIQFTNVRRNEVKSKASKGKEYINAVEDRSQRAAMILRDVDYVVEAHFDMTGKAGAEDSEAKHYNMALRRLREGQHFHAPSLGTREFPARVELIEAGQPIPRSTLGDRDLGWMLYDIDFSDPENILPKFFKAELRSGILDVSNVEVHG